MPNISERGKAIAQMHLFIVRHGQSTGNITTDDIPDGELTALGRQQAAETAQFLSDKRLTHVVSSPLIRALETGTVIAEASGIGTLEVWPELQEYRDTVHRGFGRDELRQRFPLAVLHDSIEAAGWDHGGETYESAIERGRTAIAMLKTQFGPEDRVAVATHGAFVNYLLRAILHMPDSSAIWFPIRNCAISRVRFVAGKQQPTDTYFPAETEVFSINDVAHLSGIS